ncbi:MBL fold metallo-hydrolase [Aquitalea magnusonii]|uniref:MBL fold metallo-hydrolase n=1 Tax=Aquitalea magnusonii TaxID=332411 RepID=UPI000A3EEF60|nr:MBL fold metallo-hydrolase [Aquitalea magnusonii]
MRTLTSLLGNSQKLDGGAMFGNAPRAMWSQWLAPDEQHRVPLACRCLLVREDDGRRILLEAGIGAFFAPELKTRYGVVEDGHVLLDNLAAAGCSHEDIDVVVLSHLHFDHVGGLLAAWDGGPARLLFPKASSWSAAVPGSGPKSRMRATVRPSFPN